MFNRIFHGRKYVKDEWVKLTTGVQFGCATAADDDYHHYGDDKDDDNWGKKD